jgi:hypothetical protein
MGAEAALTILGLKVTVLGSVAVSIGGVVGFSAIALVVVEVLMKNSVSKNVGVWCGAALLWRLGGFAPPFESQRSTFDRSLPRSNEGGSIPPLHTNLLSPFYPLFLKSLQLWVF